MPAAAHASIAKEPWPPLSGPGQLFVHYGEEHWNDDDGLTLLPKVVEESRRYKPALVTMSGDKDNDGTVDQLTRWRTIMAPTTASACPTSPGWGTTTALSPPGVPPGTGGLFNSSIQGAVANYKSVFAGRPYPFGDAAPYKDSNFSQRRRPANDPAGASTHYFVDIRQGPLDLHRQLVLGDLGLRPRSRTPPSPTPRATPASSSSSSAPRTTRARRG